MSIHQPAIQLLDQLSQVVRQISNQKYTQPVASLSNATIGQHVRHTLEFFLCLMDAAAGATINYDHRGHDKLIETDVTLSLRVIRSIIEFLRKEKEDFPLTLEANYSFEAENSVMINSTFWREMAYNIEHAIHHMALIKIGILSECPDLQLPPHFGVASSTVRYQNSHS